MDTKVVKITNISEGKKFIHEASGIIQSGGTVVFPTETVYGLGANALNEEAVKKIFIAKGRPQDNPLIVHVADKDITAYVKEVTDAAQKLINKFWPGPLTVILEKKDIIPNVTSANLNSIGVRMPNNEIALELIKESKVPIAAPSANISGRPSPTDVKRCVEDLDGRVDYILGGKVSEVGVESTIVDCTVNPPIVLRPGGITLEMLRSVCSDIELDKGLLKKCDKNIKPKAPGMKYTHYSPKAQVKIIKGDNKKTIEKINEMVENYTKEGKKVGVIAKNKNIACYNKDCVVKNIGDNLQEVAHNLFEVLRSFDDIGVDIILSEAFEEKEIGIAIMNRLNKSAGFDITNV